MDVSKPPIVAAEAPPVGAVRRPVERWRAGSVERVDDWVAEEVPVALEYNGVSHAVMLASPLDLEDFALGFSLAEGILDGPGQLYGVDVEHSPLGITLQLEVATEAFVRLKERRRTLAGRTGCGLCGTESLDQVRRVGRGVEVDEPRLGERATAGGSSGDASTEEGPAPLSLAPTAAPAVPTAAAIARAFAQFESRQTLQRLTGAVHAAAWCRPDGELRLLREDVGRHNALDKLVGALARQRIDASTGFFAVSSRASFEMVQKTAVAGVRLLAAVSAPTALAIETARCAGVTLVGFARRQDGVVYAGRLAEAPATTG